MILSASLQEPHLFVPRREDRYKEQANGKVTKRYIFDKKTFYTDWELNHLRSFREYGNRNLGQENSWLPNEFKKYNFKLLKTSNLY